MASLWLLACDGNDGHSTAPLPPPGDANHLDDVDAGAADGQMLTDAATGGPQQSCSPGDVRPCSCAAGQGIRRCVAGSYASCQCPDASGAEMPPAEDAGCGDTQSSPYNCGACGRRCWEVDGSGMGSCIDGVCDGASWTGCFEDGAFQTCDAYCASVGRQCVVACDTAAFAEWPEDRRPDCVAARAPASINTSDDACQKRLAQPSDDSETAYLSCCCR